MTKLLHEYQVQRFVPEFFEIIFLNLEIGFGIHIHNPLFIIFFGQSNFFQHLDDHLIRGQFLEKNFADEYVVKHTA